MSKRIQILLYFFCLSSFIARGQAVMDTVCLAAKNQIYSVNPTTGSKYIWFVEGGKIISNNGNSVVVDWIQSPGTYKIKVVEVSAFGCAGDTVIAQVIISPKMKLLISGPSDICIGEPAVLTASGALQYRWSTGQNSPSIVVKPEKTTVYQVIGFDGKCFVDTVRIKVTVHEKPRADFTFSPVKPILNENINFISNAFGASSVKWFFQEGLDDDHPASSRDSATSYSFQKGGYKYVTLVATNKAGCTDTMRYRMYIEDEVNVFVPNAFTPNGDGLNDSFKVICNSVKDFELKVFNRWGERLFESHDINQGWDGTFMGERVEEGVYMWQLSLQGGNSRWYYLKGNVTIIY